MLTQNALGAFDTLTKVWLESPVLAFTDFNKPFLLENDANRLGLGAVLSQKQTDGEYHLVTCTSWSLTVYKHNYHSTKFEFLALKWVIVEQFQEHLLCKLFVVKTDTNPLIYIMTTPNLDATWHHWVESLVGFTFSIEYHKWWDNAAADALSQITSKLDAETMKSILNRITMETIGRVDADEQVVVEADEELHKQVWETAVQARAAHAWVNLNVTNWVATQQEDSILSTMIEWISKQKVQDLKHLIGDAMNTKEGKTILQERKKLMLYQGALYHHHTPAGKLEECLQL